MNDTTFLLDESLDALKVSSLSFDSFPQFIEFLFIFFPFIMSYAILREREREENNNDIYPNFFECFFCHARIIPV